MLVGPSEEIHSLDHGEWAEARCGHPVRVLWAWIPCDLPYLGSGFEAQESSSLTHFDDLKAAQALEPGPRRATSGHGSAQIDFRSQKHADPLPAREPRRLSLGCLTGRGWRRPHLLATQTHKGREGEGGLAEDRGRASGQWW